MARRNGRLKPVPNAPSWSYACPNRTWEAKVSEHAAGFQVLVTIPALGVKKPLRLQVEDFADVERSINKFGEKLAEAGMSLQGAELEEPG